MSDNMVQLIVLAGIAIFLVLRLKNVLGTRDGFEKPPATQAPAADMPTKKRQSFEVIEGGADRDITDHVEEDSDAAQALAAMKAVDPSFGVSDFLEGARGAYEMILMAFERGEIEDIKDLLADDVYEAFEGVIEQRKSQGLIVEANFIGVREMALHGAEMDAENFEAEVAVKFVGELTSTVRDSAGDIIEGSPTDVKRQKDVWTFARDMGSPDPNWQLIATGE
jgi:predicted lipid-binding transport protein (Tim44 family)